MRLPLLALLCLLTSSLFSQLSGTYTINQTGPADYASFSAAVADLNSMGVSGPVTFTVAPGSGPYLEQIEITQGGTAGSPVTFEGNNETIEFAPTVVDEYHVVLINNASYITFNQLDVEVTTGSTTGFGYHIYGASSSNVNITNCKINVPGQQINDRLACVVANGSFSSFSNFPAQDGPNNVNIENNILFGGNTAIVMNGGGTDQSMGNTIIDNIISQTWVVGIAAEGQQNFRVEGNRILLRDIALSTFADNGVGIQVGDLAGTVELLRNRVSRYHDYGLHMYSYDDSEGGELLIENNFIGGESISITARGMWISNGATTTNVKIWHNTVIMSSGFTRAMISLGQLHADIRNNCFLNLSPDGYLFEIREPQFLTGMDYNNNYSVNDRYAWDWNGTFITSLADFLASPFPAPGHNSNSVSVDPNFLSNDNPHLVGFALEGLGQPGLSTVDIDDEMRNALTPDIGADEFTNPNEDATPISMPSPIEAVPSGTYPVIVEFQNLGTLDLNTVEVSALIDDGTTTSTVGPVTYTGPAVPYQGTATVNIGTFNFSQNAYNITLITKMPNGVVDTTTSNDELDITRGFCNSFSGNYTINQLAPASPTNFTSIQGALDEIGFCGLGGPVKLSLVPGSGPYNEQVVFKPIPGQSETNTLTIDGRGETIQYTITTSGEQYVFKLDSIDNTIIERCIFRDDNSPLESWLIMLANGNDNITIRNNQFYQRDMFDPFEPITEDEYAAIGFGNFVGGSPTGTANNIVIEENYTYGGNMGIFGYGGFSTRSIKDVLITKNEITDFDSHGIELWYSERVSVIDNDILSDATPESFSHGVRLRTSRDLKIIANNINVTAYKGIELVDNNVDTTTITMVENNLIIVKEGFDECIEVRNTYNTKIYNNSMLGLGIRTDGMSLDTDPSAGIEIKNNIIMSDASIEAYGMDWESQPDATVDFENNIWWSTTGALIVDGFDVATNLAGIISATGDANAIVADPLYTSSADLHLTAGSPAIDAGISGLVDYDFDGGLRSGTDDIGGDEFGTACEVPSGLFTDGITTSMASVHWSAAPSAQSYLLQGGKVPGGLRDVATTFTDLTFSIFQPNTTYRWRVQSICPFAESDFSAFEMFTTPTLRLAALSNASLFPNPATTQVIVQFELDTEQQLTVEIYDMNGRLMKAENAAGTAGLNSITMSVQGMPAGFYQVQLQADGEITNTSLVVE